MPDLYRLSVGSVNAAYYQRHFQRFETLGKAVPTWNHGAAFCTLAWLVLRKLWRPAALYLCLLAALLLVWWGGVHGRLPLPLELALCLLVGMLLCVVPGTLGNALYYQHVRQHTLQTLTRASSLSQARAQLAEQAVTKDRLHTIAAIQALLLAALAALTGLVLHQVKQGGPSEAPAPSGPPDLVIPQVSSLAPTQPVAFTPAADHPADTAPAAPALSLVTLAQAVPATPEAAPQVALVAEPAPAIAPAAAPAAVPVPAPALAAVSPPAAPPPAPAKKAVTPPAPVAKAPAPAKPDKTEKTDKGSKTAKAEKADKASKGAPEPKPAPAAANGRLVPGKFYLNAGVYAQAANVDKAVQQLQGAKLNALRQTVSSSKGDLTRLRIGPFDTRQQAEQAAVKAKQLRIDASVFQHPRG